MSGGSGGGFFSKGSRPDELARRTREAEEQARDDTFEASVAGFLAAELAVYNDRDVSGTEAVLDALKRDLENEVEGTVDLLFGGSVAKHTYVDGLSDVDALVLMGRPDQNKESPEKLKKILAECLVARYGESAVAARTLAITLTLHDKTIQLLPALRDGKKFRIAASDGASWAQIDPAGFATALTKCNQAMDGKLVPCIKLAKAIIGSLPEQRRLSGYHVESLAIQIFKGYQGPKTPKAMVRVFFEKAAEDVKQPIKDSSGQSIHVDEYLGEPHSLSRRIVADALDRIARRIRNADGARSLEGWKELFA
jgi:hypothetical protein